MLKARQLTARLVVLGLLVSPLGTALSQAAEDEALPILPGTSWRYFKGVEEPPADWPTVEFNDASWLEGSSGFGYGVDGNLTILDDMRFTYVSVYVRRRFDVPAEGISGLRLDILNDDAFVAYLNGTQVFSNLWSSNGTPDGPHAFDARAQPSASSEGFEWNTALPQTVVLDEFLDLLVPGTNVIAIQAHNDSTRDDDFVLLPTLGRPHDVLLNTKHSVDCNGNDVPDFADVASGTSHDCNQNGVPDECDVRGGNFGKPRLLPPVPANSALRAVADIDDDSALDLILADVDARELYALLGTGTGEFPLRYRLATEIAAVEVVAAEIDGGPGIDLVVGADDRAAPQWTVFLNGGDGEFLPAQEFGRDPGQGLRAVVADFNGDGFADLATLERREGVTLYLNDGTGFFEAADEAIELRVDNNCSTRTTHLRALDLDNDMRLDLVAVLGGGSRSACFLVLTNQGDGEFTLARHLGLSSSAKLFGVDDLSGDGNLDFFLASEPYVLRGGTSYRRRDLDVLSVALHATEDGVGRPAEPTDFPLPYAAGVHSFDADGDGDDDLVGVSSPRSTHSSYVAVFFNRGDGTFDASPATYPLQIDPWDFITRGQVLAGDFNGDARSDLVTQSIRNGALHLLLNEGGPLDPALEILPDACTVGFLRGDCDGDGRTGDSPTDAVFLLNHNFQGGPEPPCLAACDADGDGRVGGTVTDAVYLLSFSFLGGPPPPAPYPLCSAALLGTEGCRVPQCP